MAMMEMTTSNSMSVNALRAFNRDRPKSAIGTRKSEIGDGVEEMKSAERKRKADNRCFRGLKLETVRGTFSSDGRRTAGIIIIMVIVLEKS